MDVRAEREEESYSGQQEGSSLLNENLPSTYKATWGHDLEQKKVNYDLCKM